MDLRKESDFSAESGSAYEELFASLRSMLHNPIKLFAIMLLALVSSTCISLSLSYSDPLEISSNYNTGSRFAIMAAVISQSLSIQFPEDLALLIVCYYRIFSKNHQKRYEENQKFLAARARFLSWFQKEKYLLGQRKDYRIYTCPGCKQKIRIPKGKGKIVVKCPKCHTEFTKKS